MNKLKLIIAREYFSRVKKKSFILTTILAPIGFVLFMIVIILLMTAGTEQKKIAIVDESNLLGLDTAGLASTAQIAFDYNRNYTLEELKEKFFEKELDGILVIPRDSFRSEDIINLKTLSAELLYHQQLGANAQVYIKSILAQRIKTAKLRSIGIEREMLARADMGESDISLSPKDLSKKGQKDQEISSNRIVVATVLGGVMMFLIYLVIVIYGNMVMRSVMEEKTNRIVEIMISSVKPFQLMLGKIIGVGAVGLTQFGIWLITIPLLNIIVGLIFSGRMQQMQQNMPQQEVSDSDIDAIMGSLDELWTFNYGYIIFFFILFFLAGYILYASLFAAIGAAMGDDWGEGQSLTMVVIIPVVMAFYVGMAVIQDPNSTLGVFASIFPLFSPVVMPARIVFEPPVWQLILSLVLLFATCWLFVWLSGRIYRAGILMYGKKTTLRELVKWMFIKE